MYRSTRRWRGSGVRRRDKAMSIRSAFADGIIRESRPCRLSSAGRPGAGVRGTTRTILGDGAIATRCITHDVDGELSPWRSEYVTNSRARLTVVIFAFLWSSFVREGQIPAAAERQ